MIRTALALKRHVVVPDPERAEFARVAKAMEAPNAVFVFGSNLAGIHGAGAAKQAFEQYGAVFGKGYGFQGRAFAIPTKDMNVATTLPLPVVAEFVRRFLRHAKNNPETAFVVTKIGCGLAGFKEHEIAPLFKGAPDNCLLPIGWRKMNGEED